MSLTQIRQGLQEIVRLAEQARKGLLNVQTAAQQPSTMPSLLGRIGVQTGLVQRITQQFIAQYAARQRAAAQEATQLLSGRQTISSTQLLAQWRAAEQAAQHPVGLMARLAGLPYATEQRRPLLSRIPQRGIAPTGLLEGIDLSAQQAFRQTRTTKLLEQFFGSMPAASKALSQFDLAISGVQQASLSKGFLSVSGRTQAGEQISIAFNQAKQAINQTKNAQDEFLKSLGRVPGQADRVMNSLRKIGITLQDLRGVDVDAFSGTKLFQFRAVDPYTGAVRRATVAVNRWGRALHDTSTRFRGLEDMILRNTLKVFEWSVAVGLVFGAYAKIGQSIQMLKDMDLAFASMAASTGLAKSRVTDFFDTVVEVSAQTGMSLMETLSVFDDVLRMANTIRDPLQRLPAAEAFSRTIMTFSRISGMRPEESLDLLLGASMQLGDELNTLAMRLNGVSESGDRFANIMNTASVVLDTMAYISINSGVQLKDLAQTFAITGEAAAEFGLKMSDIGAMAAIISRNTPKSGMEIGNTIRRLIVGLQSESAQKVFQRYGISTTTPIVESGKIVGVQAKTFQEILAQFYDLTKSGLLGQEAIRQITYAWGGGARGAADITVLLENYKELVQLAGEASDRTKSQGTASRMLAEYNKTLDASLQRLSNSFGKLIESVGVEGGLLDIMISLTDTLSSLTKGIGDLTNVMGSSTVRIAAFTLAMAAARKYGPNIWGWAQGISFNRPQYMMGQVAGVNVPLDVRGLPLGTRLASSIRGNIGGLAAAGAYSVIGAVGQEDVMSGFIKAGSVLGGAVISTLVGGSPLVGAAIGDVISEVIIGDIQQAREQQALRETPTAQLGIEDLNKRYKGYLDSLTRSIIGPTSGIGTILTAVKTGFTGPGSWQEQLERAMEVAAKEASPEKAFQQFADVYSFLLKASGGPAGIAEELSWGEIRALFDQALADYKELQARGVLSREQAAQLTAVQSEEIKNRLAAETAIKARADSIAAQTARTRELLATGEIGVAKFREMREGLDDLMQRGPMVFDELNRAGIASIDDFVNNFARIPKEIRDDLAQVVQQIDDLMAQLPKTTSEEARSEIEKLISSLQQDLSAIWGLGMKGLLGVEQFKFPGFTEAIGLSEQQIEEAMRQAKEAQKVFADAMQVPEDVIASNAEAFYLLWTKSLREVSKAADINLKKITGLEPAIFNLFLNRQLEQARQSFNLERLSQVQPEQFPELQRRVQAWEQFLFKIPGYSAYAKKETFNLVLGEDPTFKQLITTQEALRYALEELTKVEKKQLEGMWNIPEGATVMVPLTSLYYAPKQGPTGEGGFTFAEQSFAPINEASQTTSQSLTTLSESADLAANSLAMLRHIQYDTVLRAPAIEPTPPGAGTMAMIGSIQGEFYLRRQRIEELLDEIFSRSEMEPAGGWGPAALGYGASAFKGIEQLQSPLNEMKISLSNINANTNKMAMRGNQPIYITTTVTLDGKVLARELNKYQASSLQNAAISTGAMGATVVT